MTHAPALRGTCLRVGAPRVGLQRDDEFASIAWHHVTCFNWDAHNIKSKDDVAAVAGFAALTACGCQKSDCSDVGCRRQQVVFAALSVCGQAAPLAGAKRAADAAAAAGGTAKKARTADSPAAGSKLRRFDSEEARPTRAEKVAEQLEEQPSLNLGISYIEYAKAKKPAPCMLCKGKISNGEPRVGNRMESQFYEGIQTRWMHLTCALKTRKVTRITQLEGWDRMGYDVNLEIRECTGQALSDAKEKELKTTMEALEGVQDLLCLNMTHADLVAALKFNGVNAADLLIEGDSIAMAVLLADYLAHGIPQNCPVCGNSSLSFSAGRITCWGYVDGLSKCQYKAQSCQRYKFKLPPSWAEAEWFVGLNEGVQGACAKEGKGGKCKGKGKKGASQTASQTVALTSGLRIPEEKPTASTASAASESCEERIRQLMTRQLEKTVATAVRDQDGTWNKKRCRELCATVFGDAAVEENKDFLNAEILRITQEVRVMSADQVAALADTTKAVTQDDVRGTQPSSRPMNSPPEKGSPILQVHRGYEQTGKMRYARVAVDDDGVTVYNASFTETNLKTSMNRFYIVQLLELSTPFVGYEIFCHWGRIGSKWEEEVFNKWRSTFQTYAFSTKPEGIASFKQWFTKKTAKILKRQL